MPRHEPASERRRTAPPPAPPTPDDLEAFRLHDRSTLAFTQALRDGRCRGPGRFQENVGANVAALAPLVGPWNLELLLLLYVGGPQRFSALKRGLGGVSSRVLTDKLRHLERQTLLERREEPGAVTYALTARGGTVARHLHPIVFYLQNADALDRDGPRRPPARVSNGGDMAPAT